MGNSGKKRGLMQVFVAAVLAALALPGAAMAACGPGQLDLRWQGGKARFTVELADTEPSRAKGLINRDSMAASAGMLFVYDTPRRATFWMKNTLIPLDMIFADVQGRVTNVHANAKPQDTTTIDGGDNVKFVLEINGGLARRLGIVQGAEMRHAAIDAATWPCSAE
jgi:uncharacterized membrane protein (UPF0127 family)